MNKAPASVRFAAMAVDAIVFAIIDEKLHVLVDDVNRPPHYKNIDGFPGSLIQASETAESALERTLKHKAGITKVFYEQLYTFSAVDRDKRNRVVAVAYLCLARPNVVLSQQHESAHFIPVSSVKKLAYDHNAMLDTAVKRLKGKLAYTTIAKYLLPRHFTLTELQTIYEIILGQDLDKRNFRKKILGSNIVKDTGTVQEGVKNRPAALYQFTSDKLEELSILS